MIEGISSAWGGSVVSRRLISERREGEAIGIEERGREAPWLVIPARCRVGVLDIFMIAEMPRGEDISVLLFEGPRRSSQAQMGAYAKNGALRQRIASGSRREGSESKEHTGWYELHRAHR